MEKHTLIAFVSLGFISVTALILSIIGVSNGGHERWFNKWGMMPMMGRENMMQWQMQWCKGNGNKCDMRLWTWNFQTGQSLVK